MVEQYLNTDCMVEFCKADRESNIAIIKACNKIRALGFKPEVMLTEVLIRLTSISIKDKGSTTH